MPKKALSKLVREILRREPGVQTRIARRLGVNRSTVCRVLCGKKSSQRVQAAILREIDRLVRLYREMAALAESDGGGRELRGTP